MSKKSKREAVGTSPDDDEKLRDFASTYPYSYHELKEMLPKYQSVGYMLSQLLHKLKENS